jgi:hypothetical protein
VEIVEKSIKEIEETNSLTMSGGSYTFNANVNVNTVFEGLNNITNEKERMLRESIRRWRNR